MRIAPVLGIVFVATLAYVIGIRLSESAMAVTLGVIFGVAAAIPTSIILFLLSPWAGYRGRWPRRPERSSMPVREVYIVVDPDTLRRTRHREEPPLAPVPAGKVREAA